MTELPNGEKLLAMTIYEGILIVCTCSNAYQLIDNELIPIKLESDSD